jgi:tetratricopeptide (TPR) repeat protein
VPQKSKEDWLKEGLAHRKAKHYSEALAAFEQAIQLDPTNGMYQYYKGLVHQALRQTAEAVQAYQKARELGYRW